jgi:hypothetical protein
MRGRPVFEHLIEVIPEGIAFEDHVRPATGDERYVQPDVKRVVAGRGAYRVAHRCFIAIGSDARAYLFLGDPGSAEVQVRYRV